ncbi:MAG: translation initiation factor IF-2 subunit beta [Candidatus Micrarchaeaceae archaeon]
MEDSEYERLLERAYAKVSSLSSANVDFVIPKVESMREGTKTIVTNITAIADKARRNPNDIMRYLSKEFGVPISMDRQRLIINGRFDSSDIDAKIKKYFDTYVICKECHKPDSHLESAGRGMLYFVCEACGARYAIKSY